MAWHLVWVAGRFRRNIGSHGWEGFNTYSGLKRRNLGRKCLKLSSHSGYSIKGERPEWSFHFPCPYEGANIMQLHLCREGCSRTS